MCERVCYMDVKISEHVDQKTLRDINCIYCGRCLDACNTKTKLVKMSLSFSKKNSNSIS
ncbi:MAG: hypothetical protein LLF28_03215 [Nitrospiraceae bacterium]|nr:hypothetical protein [Nitrospiraceae bacterium]